MLLVVDDDQLISQSIKLALPDQWRMMVTHNAVDLPERGFHAALVDMHLSGNVALTEGVDVIRRLRQKHPHLEIVAMSGDLDRAPGPGCVGAE